MKKHVYIISNQAFPGMLKVGVATNLKSRLSSYQTSDPNRAYKLEYSVLTANWDEIEKNTHSYYENKHEWVLGSVGGVTRFIEDQMSKVDHDFKMGQALELLFPHALPKIAFKIKESTKNPLLKGFVVGDLEHAQYEGESFRGNRKLIKFANDNLESITGMRDPFVSSWSFEDMGLNDTINEIVVDSENEMRRREAVSAEINADTRKGCATVIIVASVILFLIAAVL